MRVLFIFPIVFLAGFFLQPVSAQDTRVLLVHSRHDVKNINNEYLVGYYFKHGKFIKQDTLLHRSRVQGSDDDGRVSIGLGGDQLFYDRYLLTTIALIIDLQEKKVLREDANMELLEEKDRKLYFNNTFFNAKLDMFAFDLDKHTYKKVLSRPFEGFVFNPHLCSDDYNHFLEIGYESPGKTNISVIDSTGHKQKLLIDDNNYPQSFSGSKAAGKEPITWVDNDHFVYAHYIVHPKTIKDAPPLKNAEDELVFAKIEPDSLPCCSVELQEVDIKTGVKRFVTTINGIYQPMTDDRIYSRNGDRELVFRNKGVDTIQTFRIDRYTGEIKEYEYNRYPFRSATTLIYGEEIVIADSIFFGDQPLGRFHVVQRNYADSVLVIWGSKEPGAPSQLHVWSMEYPQWQSLPVGQFLGFLGWITKKADDE